ncbi:SDR family NAD(P)-dependent oxidoreductase [Synechococcus sp. UW179A]|uniref:SDR family NAD(P)-dependent oxidoreductase n=1 Tax=Synechococcus sp. UW179A TaxID=2575510 RepID=UPI001482DD11|nr:SDR family oxidoreductase [Synechococcus sp. UW179A]
MITGCSKGIGLAVLSNQLRLGQIIIGISRSETMEIKELRDAYPDTFIFKQYDLCQALISSPSFFLNGVDKPSFNYCVLNAGIRSRVPIVEATNETYQRVIDVNSLSPLLMANQLAQINISKNKGLNVLFVSSIVGNLGFSELSTYATSKSALDGFMRSFAVEMAPFNIRANSIAPGFVKTSYYENFVKNKPDLYEWTLSRTPMNRWATSEEIAKCVQFLVSSDNSYMTGSTVYCDGGWTAS